MEYSKKYLADLEERCDELRSRILEWDMEEADCCIPSFDVVYDDMLNLEIDHEWFDFYHEPSALCKMLGVDLDHPYNHNITLEEELDLYFYILEE